MTPLLVRIRIDPEVCSGKPCMKMGPTPGIHLLFYRICPERRLDWHKSFTIANRPIRPLAAMGAGLAGRQHVTTIAAEASLVSRRAAPTRYTTNGIVNGKLEAQALRLSEQ